MNAVEVEGVTKRHGEVTAIDDVSLEVAPGTVLGLLGPNGAGKSTLLTVISGLARPDRGAVRVCGIDVHREPVRAHRHLGLAAQDVALYPPITVRENLALFARLAGVRDAVARRVEEVASWLGLEHLLDRQVRTLSGGERRRAHVAVAVVHRPDVLILDEPTTSLDPGSRRTLTGLVARLAGEGTAICYSTNQIAEAEELSGSVAILDRGRLIARGSPQELSSQYATPFVEVLFEGAAPAISGPAVEVIGPLLRCRARDAGTAVAETLAMVDGHAHRIRRIDLLGGDLEAVFLSLTGRRYAPEGTPGTSNRLAT